MKLFKKTLALLLSTVLLLGTLIVPVMHLAAAGTTETRTINLLDLSEIAADTILSKDNLENWPKGMTVGDFDDYDGTRSVVELEDGTKALKLAFDKKQDPAPSSRELGNIANYDFKFTIPAAYRPYINSVKLTMDNKSNVFTSWDKELEKPYFLLAFTNGTNYSKIADKTLWIEKVDYEYTLPVAGIAKVDWYGYNYWADTNGTKWTAQEKSGMTDVVLSVTVPYIDDLTTYMLIKGLELEIEGTKEELDAAEKAANTIIRKINLLDLSETAADTILSKENLENWPNGMTVGDFDDYDGTRSVVQLDDGTKALKLAFDKKQDPAPSNRELGNIANYDFKFTIPAAYRPYINSVKLTMDNKSNVFTSWDKELEKPYFLLAFTNGTHYSKIADKTLWIDKVDYEYTLPVAGIAKVDWYGYNYWGDTNGTKWTEEEKSGMTDVVLSVTVPYIDDLTTYMLIKGLELEIEGTKEELDAAEVDAGIITKTINLLDLSEIPADTVLSKNNTSLMPNGLSWGDFDDYNGTRTVVDLGDGKKGLKLAFDKKPNTAPSQTDVFSLNNLPNYGIKVEIPAAYSQYVTGFKFVIDNQVSEWNGSWDLRKSYHLLGFSDGTNYAKSSDAGQPFTVKGDNTIQFNITDKRKVSGADYCDKKDPNWFDFWTVEENEEIAYVTADFTLPYDNCGTTQHLVVKEMCIVVSGTKAELEQAGQETGEINKDLVSFDSVDTVEDINASGAAAIYANNGTFSICKDDAHTAPNSLLYKSETDQVNYDTSFNISLEKRAVGCVGIEFYVKNLDATQSVNLRSILVVGSGTNEKKYQYIKDVAPSENGEYTRIRILFDDIGLVTGDEFWGGSNDGNSLSRSEIKNLVTLRLRTPYMTSKHAGILFDSFKLITEDDVPKPEDLVRRMLDFEDCEVGDELPENVIVNNKYGGNIGVAKNSDGNKVFRINYDLETSPSLGTKISDRPYVQLQLNIPKTSLKGATEIRVGMTNNAVSFKEPWEQLTNIFQVVGIRGGGYYGKIPENADRVYDKGVLTEIKLPLDKMIRAEGSLTGWNAPTQHWTKSQLEDVVQILVFITAPTCDGTEGWSFDINYIDVYYEDAAQNYETDTRCAVKANRLSDETNSYISAENIKISKNDPNYSLFTTAWKLNINKSETPKPLKFLNTYTNYYTDLSDFTDTATLGFYLQADTPLDLQITLKDKAGEPLKFKVSTNPPENSAQYGVYQLSLKEILKNYYTENPEGSFDISDIRFLEVLPISESGLPGKIMLSGLSIWTMEIGSTVVYSGYHYSDNGVTVDAYNDYLPLDTVTVVESEDAKTAVKNFGIKLPEGLTPILFKTITLYTVNGSVTEPTGRIWLSFELEPNTDLSDISIYKVFFDGSYVKQRYAVEDGSIAINSFTTGSFLITKGKIKQTSNENQNIGNVSEDYENTGNTGNFIEDTSINDTNNAEESETTTVIKKVIRKVVRKKGKKNDGLPVWAIALISTGSLAVVGGGAVTTVILVKKRKKGGIA